MMSECNSHYFLLGSGQLLLPTASAHVLTDKPADVINLKCDICGHTLFIYYRHAPPEGDAIVKYLEGDADTGADHDAQPQDGPQQQKEGNKE